MGKTFSSEFRDMIVHLHLDDGKSIKELADEYGISASTVGRWVIHYRNKKAVGNREAIKR